jgi:hypothetical protein
MTPLRAVAISVLLSMAFLASPGRSLAQEDAESAARPSPYGVNAHVPTAAEFKAIQKAGFGWARVDLTWNWVEPAPGLFRWDELDRLVTDARGRGVRLVGILGYCPAWASSGPDIFYPPRDTAQWKNYVRAMVGRYRGEIRHWILWNEPNCNTYFRGTVDQYIVQVLIPGARAVKEANPEALVCGPDLAHLSGCDWDRWMDKILADQGAYFDVITHHCYKEDPDEVFRQIDGRKWPWEPPSVRDILRRHGQGDKPFFLTETGWRSTKVGEAAQAGNLTKLLQGVVDRPWLHKVFLYELRDSTVEPGYGLLRVDHSPKPSYRAVRRFIKAHPAGRP